MLIGDQERVMGMRRDAAFYESGSVSVESWWMVAVVVVVKLRVVWIGSGGSDGGECNVERRCTVCRRGEMERE